MIKFESQFSFSLNDETNTLSYICRARFVGKIGQDRTRQNRTGKVNTPVMCELTLRDTLHFL